MDSAVANALREQLLDRERRLRSAIGECGDASDLVRLLSQVDSALKKVEQGGFGSCDVCGEDVASEDLRAHPLLPWCYCDLSAEGQRALEHDMGLAARIQWALLPPQDLEVDGWEVHHRYMPAGPVGGDYIDVVPRRDDGALYLLLGDVSGKGIAASMFMARLNGLFRTLIQSAHPIVHMVDEANRLFQESKVSSHYATLVCGRASADGQLEICNAGHCRPLLLRGGSVSVVEATGFPVGLLPGAYDSRCARLDPGDILFLYTDGLSEARSPSGDELGDRRIAEVIEQSAGLSARAIVASVLRRLSQFQEGTPRSDDLTVMAVTRLPVR